MSKVPSAFTFSSMKHDTFGLGSPLIVGLDSDLRIIDFQETRFRYHASVFQAKLLPLATELAKEAKVQLSTSNLLLSEKDSSLRINTYVVYDILDLKRSSKKGYTSYKWLPLSVFSKGIRVLSLHASYDSTGVHLSGITIHRDGKDEYSRCSTLESALKVSRSFLRSFLKETKS